MDQQFYNFTRNINKIHNAFMGFIDQNICRNFLDLSPNQVLLIKNIGEDAVIVNSASNIGYYTGTNISYNIRWLVKKNYVTKSKYKHDARKVYLKLTQKGLNVLSVIDSVFGSHTEVLQSAKIDDKYMKDINKILCKLQKTFEI
jgi:DNA-binding MarR family transcriptional regulator